MNTLSELKRYKNKYRRLKNFVIEQREKQEQEEKDIDSLISELEEAKRTEEELKDLLDEKEKSCQKLEIEMVDLKRKFEANNNVHDRLKNNSIILDKILVDSQKSPFDKTGIGYKKEEEQYGIRTWILKKPKENTTLSRMKENSSSSELERKLALQRPAKNREDIGSRRLQGIDQGVGPTPQSRFRKETIPRWNQISRNGNGFNSYCYCYSCNNFGHKALDCISYVKRNVGNPNNSVRCWTCNHIGHTAAYCRTIRSYICSGIGHKAQDCWKSRRKPIRRSPYNPTRNVNEYWTKSKRMKAQKRGTKEQPRRNDVEKMKYQRIGTKDKKHSQT